MWDATEFREIWMKGKSEGLDFTESLEKVREMKPTTVGHTRVQEEGPESGGFSTQSLQSLTGRCLRPAHRGESSSLPSSDVTFGALPKLLF